MAKELKATVVNMKHLSQDIDDPIVIGAGDANGRTLRIIFTQEAAAQLTPETKVYLSWLHQEKNIKGYNVFTEITDPDNEDFPPTWEIHYPQSMLWEGNVLACIQLVDSVSISSSTNFTIHILSNPNDGSEYELSDDFSDFKKMIIRINCLEKQMKDQMESQKIEFEDMQLIFQRIQQDAAAANEKAEEAKSIAENTQSILSSSLGELDNKITEMQNLIEEIKDKTDIDFMAALEEAKREMKQYTDNAVSVLEV